MVDQPVVPSLAVPTEDERSLALLSHLLQVFTGFIGPVVIYCIKQNSRFVRFHALQCLIWQLCYSAVCVAGVILFFFFIFVIAIVAAASGHAGSTPPSTLILIIPIFWLTALAGWVTNLVIAIRYGIRANRGEWAAYPIIGKWCLPKATPGISPA